MNATPPPLPPKPASLGSLPPQIPPKPNWQAAQINAPQGAKVGGVTCGNRLPAIGVDWRDNDFGRVLKGKSLTKDLTITSTGGQNLVIQGVALADSQFSIANPGGWLTTLPPGASTKVKVKFEPNAYGEKTAIITITSNGSNENPIAVTLKGKMYSVITFVLEQETTNKPIANATLKVEQTGQAEITKQTDAHGKAEVETEVDGTFKINSCEHATSWEFQSVASA